jgi:nitrite reductase/ring-hydroxylating ferredoxin subunit
LAFERVASLEDVPEGRGLCVRVGGLEIGVYRVADELHAMENTCPHAGYPLHEGDLEDRVIYCAGHGWPFDVTTGRPPDAPGGGALARYPVRVVDGGVEIDVDAALP